VLPIILSTIVIIGLIFSISFIVQKRKKADITGIKSALTSICFFLIAVTNLLAYWFDFMGIIHFLITVMLLILAAYFTKYLRISER